MGGNAGYCCPPHPMFSSCFHPSCAMFFSEPASPPPPPPPPLLSTDNFPDMKRTSINWSLYTILEIFIIFRGYNSEMPSNFEPSASPPGSCINNRSTHLTFRLLDLPISARHRPPLLNLNPGHCKSHHHYYQPFLLTKLIF